jgi:hypothetical protein
MDKNDSKAKKVLELEDLDVALEVLARKLKPLATGDCGQTAIPSNAYHTKGQTCGCPCCSDVRTSCLSNGRDCFI